MTTPPSSPALSEARDEARAYVMGHRSEPDGPVWPDQRGLAAIDNLIALAHASGLAAGREQADAEWRKLVDAARKQHQTWCSFGKTLNAPCSCNAYAWNAALDKLAALRSPVGG